MFLQDEKIAKNMAISKKAMDVNELLKLAKTSPQGADAALDKAWENLHIAVGESVIPIIIPALLKFADVLRDMGQWIAQHPVRFDWIIKGFAGLSAALLFSGAVLTLKAAFLGLSLVFSPLRIALSGAATAVGSMTLALGALAAVAAAFAVAYYHQEIADKIDSTGVGQSVGDWLYGVTSGKNAAENRNSINLGGANWSAPPSGKQIAVQTQVNLDGKQIATVVSQHQANAMNGPATSGSGFDGRQSFIAPSWGGM